MSKRYLFTVIVFALWVVSFYLASTIGGIDLIAMFLRVSPGNILLGLLFYVIFISSGILILYRLLRYTGAKPPVRGVAKAWIFGSFIDNISPTVAPLGQVGVAYFLEKFYGITYSQSLAAIGIYVSSWGISASLFAASAIFLSQIFVGILQDYLLFALLALAFYIGVTIVWLLLLTRKELLRRIVHGLVRPYNKVYNKVKRGDVTFAPEVYDIAFDRAYSSLDKVIENKRHVISSIALFLIPQLGQVLCLYFMILGFGVQIPFFGLVMVHVVSSMIVVLAIVPAGLFVYETAVVTLASSVAPGTGQFILAAVLLYRLIFLWTTNMLGGAIGVLQGIGKIEHKSGFGKVI